MPMRLFISTTFSICTNMTPQKSEGHYIKYGSKGDRFTGNRELLTDHPREFAQIAQPEMQEPKDNLWPPPVEQMA
jgi:hypothetical protein